MSDPMTLDDDLDPALAAAVLEVESHAAGEGWDQPSRLYALASRPSPPRWGSTTPRPRGR